MIASKISAILYILLKFVFNRSYEGQQWLDTLYFVVEPLCFTLILFDLYDLHFIFEIVFYVALSSLLRQLFIYFGWWEYDFVGRKYFVEIFFLIGICVSLIRHGRSNIRKNTYVD